MDRRLSYFDNISECIYTNCSSISLYKYPIEKYNLSILKNRGNDDSETFNSEGNALQKSYMLLIIILKSKPLQSLIRFKSAVMSSPNILKYRFNYCIELEQIGFRAVYIHNYHFRKLNRNMYYYYHCILYLLMDG